jgi:hypothetical protein
MSVGQAITPSDDRAVRPDPLSKLETGLILHPQFALFSFKVWCC